MKTVAAASLAFILSALIAAPCAAQPLQGAQVVRPAEQHRMPNRAQMGPSVVANPAEERTPRFTVKVFRFDAIDETGSTSIGSDEIRMSYRTPTYWVSTSEFGDVDSGESRNIEVGQQCVFPARDNDGQNNDHWSCIHQGRPGPISFTVSINEQDWALIPDARYCPPSNDVVSQADCPLYAVGNIGYFTREFTVAQLVNLLPEPWDSEDLSVDVGGHDSRYRIHYRITRTSDLISTPPATQ